MEFAEWIAWGAMSMALNNSIRRIFLERMASITGQIPNRKNSSEKRTPQLGRELSGGRAFRRISGYGIFGLTTTGSGLKLADRRRWRPRLLRVATSAQSTKDCVCIMDVMQASGSVALVRVKSS
jgi:hypothetical protein